MAITRGRGKLLLVAGSLLALMLPQKPYIFLRSDDVGNVSLGPYRSSIVTVLVEQTFLTGHAYNCNMSFASASENLFEEMAKIGYDSIGRIGKRLIIAATSSIDASNDFEDL